MNKIKIRIYIAIAIISLTVFFTVTYYSLFVKGIEDCESISKVNENEKD